MDLAAEIETLVFLLLLLNVYNTYRIASLMKLCLSELSMARWESGCRSSGLRPESQKRRDRVEL